jgi:hypothetical protein
MGCHYAYEELIDFTQETVARDGSSVSLSGPFQAAIDWHQDRFLRMVEGSILDWPPRSISGI